MKKIFLITTLLLTVTAASFVGQSSFAETRTVIAAGSFDVSNIFMMEFYTGEPSKYLYTTQVSFTNMDPTKTWVQADNRSQGDGNNDIGLLCKSNLGETWYLKIQGSPGGFFLEQVKYGFWRPWNMRYGQSSNGALIEGWQPLPTSPARIFTAGANDLNNMGAETWQQGTLCGFSFAINPSQLDANNNYACQIQFTMTLSA
ncbi:MAG: hypothetical protein HQ549_05230 [Candidatus Omnitrophica bacterium]|nr:hypothetical protein [Candidatus Omnitrophota bacterium]